MTSGQADPRLRAAFQALGAEPGVETSDADIELVWQAVTGALPADQRRTLVERMAADAGLAQAWRIAHDLWQGHQSGAAPLTVARSRSWSPAWMAMAAALIVFAGVGVGLIQRQRDASSTFREAGGYVVESLVATDAALPKRDFVLRWQPGPTGSRYLARVTTEDLRVLATAPDLTRPELRVDEAALAEVASGTRILWQVEVTLPAGERVSSQTFIARVE